MRAHTHTIILSELWSRVHFRGSSFPFNAIPHIAVIYKCPNLKQQPLYSGTVGDGSGIGTGHSRVACLCSVMSRAAAGKAWLAKGNSSSQGGCYHLEVPHPLVWRLDWDHSQAGLSWGCQTEHWHVASLGNLVFSQHGVSAYRSWTFQDSQERHHGAFSDLAQETTWHQLIVAVKVVTNLLKDEQGTYPQFLTELVSMNLGTFIARLIWLTCDWQVSKWL